MKYQETKYNIEIDSDTIHEFSKNIVTEGNNFISILDEFLKDVEEMETFFDTPTGKKLKEKLENYIKDEKNIVNNKYIEYSNVIEKIATIYDQTNNNIKASISK